MLYLLNNLPRMAELFGQHLFLTLSSLALAILLGLPIGILIFRIEPLRGPVLAVLGVIYTIPSLSLLVLLIPLTGLSPATAVIVLVAYAQLVLVRNTLAGLMAVDPAIVEAARGMGMNYRQRLLRIELPLASPVILAGVRLATIAIIGIGTIAAFISAGGLGVLLFEGVRTSNYDKIVAGAIAVSVLAIGMNWILRVLEKRQRCGCAARRNELHRLEVDESSAVANCGIPGAEYRVGFLRNLIRCSMTAMIRKEDHVSVSSPMLNANAPSLADIERLDKELKTCFEQKLVVHPALTRSLVSFQANKGRPIHRWYKYKEAFSASLVEYLFERYKVTAGRVLDPFAGIGTALFTASSDFLISRRCVNIG